MSMVLMILLQKNIIYSACITASPMGRSYSLAMWSHHKWETCHHLCTTKSNIQHSSLHQMGWQSTWGHALMIGKQRKQMRALIIMLPMGLLWFWPAVHAPCPWSLPWLNGLRAPHCLWAWAVGDNGHGVGVCSKNGKEIIATCKTKKMLPFFYCENSALAPSSRRCRRLRVCGGSVVAWSIIIVIQ